jgi:sugar/nucleoside kinase (ribokinase family)
VRICVCSDTIKSTRLIECGSATSNSIPHSSHNLANMQPPPINQESALASPSSPSHDRQTVDIIVFGSLASDLICDYNPIADSMYSSTPVQYTSNPAIITQSIGGVGHNITLAASYTGASVLLSSVVADDLTGRSLLDLLEKSGLQTTGIVKAKSSRARTAQYVAVNDRNKDLLLAMADMAILQDQSLDLADQWSSLVSSNKPKWVVVDGNWSPSHLRQIVDLARRNQAQVAFEPVSVQKSMRLFHPDCRLITPDGVLPNHLISLATPNSFELETMHRTAREVFLFESPQWWAVINSFELSATGSRDKLSALTSPALVDQGVPQQTIQLLPYIPNLVVKLGAQGCLLAYLLPRGDGALTDPDAAPYILARCDTESGSVGGVYMRLFGPAEAVPQEDVVSVNGVGDTLLGVLIAGLVGKGEGKRLEDLIPVAQHAAVKALKSPRAVSPELKTALKASGTAPA